MVSTTSVDHAAIRTGQVLAIVMLSSAYVFDSWQLVALQSVVFLLTAVNTGPYTLLYQWLLRPLGIVKPDLREDNPEPHRFGQAIGAVFAALAALLLFMGYEFAGWLLVGLLAALTAVSYLGWCIGCFIYYQLNRLGLGGFFSRGPTDTGVLGTRPRRRGR